MATGSTADPYNAFIDPHLTIPGAAAGPLKGTTFAVKDLFDIAGQRTGFGNPVWRDTHPPAAHTSPAVQALLDAGSSLAGKTHMDELAYSLNGENVHYGTPTNPAAPGRIPGGSSSGSAVAVAAGQSLLALGSDTGGSVRVPASYCGVAGMRPTWGRISLAHARPLAPSFDTVGWFARDAATLRAAGEVLLGAAGRGPASLSRCLLATDAMALAEPATREALQAALARVAAQVSALLGAPQEVEVASGLAGQGLGRYADWMGVFRVCQGFEVWQEHGAWVSSHEPRFGPGIKDRFLMASRISPQEAAAAGKQRQAIREHLEALLGGDAVLLLPTAPGPAPLCNTPAAQLDEWRTRLISLTSIAGLAGLPQVSLPVARVDGLPVGLSLIGPAGSDEALLHVSEQLMAHLAPGSAS